MPLGDPNVAFAAKIGAARAQNEFIKIASIARSGLAARRRCAQTTALAESLGGPGRRVSCAGLAADECRGDAGRPPGTGALRKRKYRVEAPRSLRVN